MKFLEEVIQNRILELGNDLPTNPFITFNAISQVPHISFPNLTERECLEIQEQTKEVLRISKRENSNNEVAITYSLTDTSNCKEKYKIVKGNIASVDAGEDEETIKLLKYFDENDQLVVISIHNHPDKSFFSLTDLLFFEAHSSIKIMVVVNKDGESAFMLRPKFQKYSCVIDNILEAEPNILKKIQEVKSRKQEVRIKDLIPDEQIRKEILKLSISLLKENGIFVQPYVNKDSALSIDFSDFVFSDLKQPLAENFVDTNDGFEYLENGEDGYEWDE